MSFKETPIGTNITYDCSPSGPCVPCTYSEKVLLFFLFQFDNFDDYFIFYSNACIVQLPDACLFIELYDQLARKVSILFLAINRVI